MELSKSAKVSIISGVVRSVKTFALSGALVSAVRIVFPAMGVGGMIATAVIGGITFAISDIAEKEAIETTTSDLLDTIESIKNGEVKLDVVVF